MGFPARRSGRFQATGGQGYVDIREHRGARVIAMGCAALRDFFLVAPLIYEAVGRWAAENFKPAQMRSLKECQERFRPVMQSRDAASMAIENNGFHAIIGGWPTARS